MDSDYVLYLKSRSGASINLFLPVLQNPLRFSDPFLQLSVDLLPDIFSPSGMDNRDEITLFYVLNGFLLLTFSFYCVILLPESVPGRRRPMLERRKNPWPGRK